jgi:hypothetical protein
MGRRTIKPDRNAIARVAYELYLRRGKESGCDLQDWFEAERLLQEEGKHRAQQTRTRGDWSIAGETKNYPLTVAGGEQAFS